MVGEALGGGAKEGFGGVAAMDGAATVAVATAAAGRVVEAMVGEVMVPG